MDPEVYVVIADNGHIGGPILVRCMESCGLALVRAASILNGARLAQVGTHADVALAGGDQFFASESYKRSRWCGCTVRSGRGIETASCDPET